MMAYICLIWIGATLSAPWWYYVLLGVGALAKVFKATIDAIKEASDGK